VKAAAIPLCWANDWKFRSKTLVNQGETSADGLKRIAAVEAMNPRVVLLCFGGNDVLQNLPQERMLANVSSDDRSLCTRAAVSSCSSAFVGEVSLVMRMRRGLENSLEKRK
jgi:hypothetical protein